MREMVELETRAKKEIELDLILDEITYKWDQVVRFSVDNTSNEIQKPDQIFDEIDDSFAKVADIQSNKYGAVFEKDINPAENKFGTDTLAKFLQAIQNLMLKLIEC